MQKQRGVGIIAFFILILFLAAFIVLGIYLVKLDDIVRKRFEGQRWDIPAKVYARPLELYAQSDATQKDILDELKLLNYQGADHYSKTGTFTHKANQLTIHTRGFDFGDSHEPERVIELNFAGDTISSIRTTQPSSTGVLRLEPMLIGGIYPQHNEDRVLVKLQNVPQTLIDALIATEDRNFYQHYGVSVRGLARAIFSNVTGGTRQGGSTLTQQLVKNFYLTPERTYKRKANEALMALLLELHYDKNEILEAYLNEVNLGQSGNYSVNGYGLASQFYFGQPLQELNTSELAFLVGLVNGPSFYNPWRNPERAVERRNAVLQKMRDTGKLSDAQYQAEIARPLGVMKKPGVTAVRFPDFMDIVRRQLKQEYQENDLTNQGLRIFTTLDPVAQTRIQTSVENTVQQLVKRNPARLNGLQGAVVVSHPENGEIIAAIGSTSDFTGFNRVLDAKRQVGSLLKPVIYMQALQSGRYTWASPIQDHAVVIKGVSEKEWTPKNYDGVEHGTTTLQTALANSYNLSAVRLGWEAGLPTFINNLRKLGIQSDIPNYPSILLGAVNLSPLEILGIYQNFATGGFKYPTRTIRAVVDANGSLLQRYGLQVQNTIDPTTAYLLNHGLQQVMSSGTGRAGYNSFPSELGLAGKSGTTNDARDSWFAGYSGNYLTVVWLGQDDNKPIGLTGSTGALPVWISVMKQLKNTANNLPQPSDIQWQWMDSSEGLLSAQGCTGAIYIPMVTNSIPRQATSCGLPHYQVEPEYSEQSYDEFGNPASPTPSRRPNDDAIENFIRESEPTQPTEQKPQVLSQGGYRMGAND
ncbi:MAG: penicillin-binding protein 1B [Acinetobacter sp.]|nr:MAG: penicillin-binding protein 1B [Acinetobacter sp.]